MLHRTRRPFVALLVAAAATVLMAEAVLGSYTSPFTLRTAGSAVPLRTDDLAANGGKIAVGWTEYGSGGQVTFVQPELERWRNLAHRSEVPPQPDP